MKPFDGGKTLVLVALGMGLLGLLLFLMQPHQIAWLIAWVFLASIALGALIFLLACHTMNAGWPTAIRGPIELVAGTLPFLALGFVPLWFAHLQPVQAVAHRNAWLQRPFLLGRTLGCLAVWSALTFVLRGLSRKLETPGHEATRGTLQSLSAAALPLVGLTLTLFSFDWIMSLSPDFQSSVFGIYFFAGGFLAALALITIAVAAMQPWLPPITRSHWYALGRLLFAFVIFWAYIAYFQFFLIWIANKPIEAHWYLIRIRGGYRALSWLLGLGQFAIPFLALLPYWTKQGPRRLLPICVLLLAVHYLDIFWLIAPEVDHRFGLADAGALMALSGFSLAFMVWRARGRLLAPLHDPQLPAAIAYESA